MVDHPLLHFESKRCGVLPIVARAMARAGRGIGELQGMLAWVDAEPVDGETRIELLRVESEQLYGNGE